MSRAGGRTAAEERPIASVWTGPRRQRAQLGREQIVSEAVSLLDAEGLDALSMRKLGTRLDAGANFEYGLQRVLDGLQAGLGRTSGS